MNDIVKPAFFRRNKDTRSLEKIKIDSTSITVEMEPKSTLRVEKSDNYLWKSRIATLEIDGKVYTIQELHENSDEIKNDYIFKIK